MLGWIGVFLCMCVYVLATKRHQATLRLPCKHTSWQVIEVKGYYVAQLVLPSLSSLCPSSMREARFVFNGREQAQRPILRRGQTCFCFLSLPLMCAFRGKKEEEKNQWVESHRSDSKKLYLVIHLFSFTAEARWGFRESKRGRDKGVQEMNQRGVIEALCDSVDIMKRGTPCTDNRRHSSEPQTDRKQSHESVLIVVFPLYTCCLDAFQDT